MHASATTTWPAASASSSWSRCSGPRGCAPQDARITPAGRTALTGLGIPVGDLEARTRPVVRTCPDWTERRPHLAGGLGAALATLFTDRGWVRRRDRGRGLDITRDGADELLRVWSVRPDSWT